MGQNYHQRAQDNGRKAKKHCKTNEQSTFLRVFQDCLQTRPRPAQDAPRPSPGPLRAIQDNPQRPQERPVTVSQTLRPSPEATRAGQDTLPAILREAQAHLHRPQDLSRGLKTVSRLVQVAAVRFKTTPRDNRKIIHKILGRLSGRKSWEGRATTAHLQSVRSKRS